MRTLLAFAALVAVCDLSGCASGTPGAKTEAQAIAITRGTIESVDSAWRTAAQGCVDWSAGDAAKLGKCRAELVPAQSAIVAASLSLDAWQAGASRGASEGAIACDLKAVSGAITAASLLGVGMPAAVITAQGTVAALVCPSPVDAGDQ